MKKSLALLHAVLFILILSGCVTMHVGEITPVLPDLHMSKKLPLNVALIVPASTLQLNAMTVLPTSCSDVVAISVAPYPFGETFRKIATGTFAQMFDTVEVIPSLLSEKDYDLVVEVSLSDLAGSIGCENPGMFFKAEGTLKLFDGENGSVLTEYRGSVKRDARVDFWKGQEPYFTEDIGATLSELAEKYAQELSSAPGFVRYVKNQNKPNNQQTAGISGKSALVGVSKNTDVDTLPPRQGRGTSNSYAIVIGVEHYRQKLPSADYATNDALTMTSYLTKVLGFPEENVVTLLNDRASNVDLAKYFEKWLPNNVEAGGTVFVYYSGHGAPNPKTGDAYLVPYDGDPAFIDETGYSLKRMYAALGKLPAKEIVVALDSCFSGAGGRSVIAKGARSITLNLKDMTPTARNLTVLAASSGEQMSSTYDEKGHGLFTYFLLKGIKNEEVTNADGSLRLDDLFAYLGPQVERIARKQYNNEQTPQLIGAGR